LARTVKSIDSRKAQTSREPSTGNPRTKSQTAVKRTANIRTKGQRFTGSRKADVTAGRFRHGTAGASTPEAEKQPAAISIRARR
jgi:hypothetical protein